jgi:hypothetical protein
MLLPCFNQIRVANSRFFSVINLRGWQPKMRVANPAPEVGNPCYFLIFDPFPIHP